MIQKTFRPIAIDLFAGAGGLSLGIEQAGFDIVGAIEIDPIHSAVHEYNFPYSKVICSDINNLTGKKIRKLLDINDREIDLIVGGAPCQGFSLIGKRMFDDPRNLLVGQYIRIIKELQPKYFVFENVKGITIGKHKQFLHELIKELKKAGYEVEENYKVLNASDFGVPQDRKRLFLLGARKGLKLPNYPVPIKKKVNVNDAINDLPNADDFDELINDDSVNVRFKSKTNYQKIMRGILIDEKDFSYFRNFNKDFLTSSMRTNHTKESIKRFFNTQFGKVEPISRFHKLNPDGLCNTLRAGTGSERGAFTSPRPIHPFYHRVITVREAARLHSYPDWFRFHVTKWHGFRQIGNSVPPLLARAVGMEIIKAGKYKALKPKIKLNLINDFLLKLDLTSASKYYKIDRNALGNRLRKEKLE